MTPNSYDIPLHDIKPLMEVPDSSFGFLMVVVTVSILLIAGLSYVLYTHFQNKKRTTIRKEHFTSLKNINFSNPKEASYQITYYGRTFSNDSERLHEAYHNLLEYLEAYKYKKSVEQINDESRSYYKIYLEMIDV